MAGFAAVFAASFAGVAQAYIGPVMAQAALVEGAAWELGDSGLLIGGKVLIGPAGKVFSFVSAETAARWVENAKTIGRREREIVSTISAQAAEVWKEKKRVKLAVVAGRVVEAAARQKNEGKRAALLAESSFLLAKWG